MRKLGLLGIFVLIAALLGTIACGRRGDNGTAAPADVLAADLDTAVQPGTDFFAYANGGWINRNPIPNSESTYGIGNEVQDDIYAKLRTISQQAADANHPAEGSDQQKIGDFWAMANNTAHADQLGLTPIQPQLDRIATVQTPAEALVVAGELEPLGVGSFYSFGIVQDEKNSAAMTVHLGQGGLGLPNRDFYFNPEAGVAKYPQGIRCAP